MRVHQASSLLPKVERGRRLQLTVDGLPVEAFEGETVAAALLASGIRTLDFSPKKHEPRGIYCGIGLCYQCLMTIDDEHSVRACQTLVADGMRVETGKDTGL